MVNHINNMFPLTICWHLCKRNNTRTIGFQQQLTSPVSKEALNGKRSHKEKVHSFKYSWVLKSTVEYSPFLYSPCLKSIQQFLHPIIIQKNKKKENKKRATGGQKYECFWGQKIKEKKLTYPTHCGSSTLASFRSFKSTCGSLDVDYKQCSTLWKNSLLLSPFHHSKEQMRIGEDEGDKGWKDKAQRWK